MHDYQVPGLEIKPEQIKNEGYINLVFPCVGVAGRCRLTLLVSPSDYDELDNEVAAIAGRTEQQLDVFNFKDSIDSFGIYGFSLNGSPSANHAIALLNLASYIRPQTIEADFLAGLSLLAARKFVQAAEFIRRAESELLENLDNMPANSPRVLGSPPFKTSSGTQNKRLIRAAQMELLVAEGFNQHGQLFDKLVAYQRATQFYLGQRELENVQFESDAYTNLIKLQPHLGRLLLRNLGEKLEPLRMACLRGIEFLIEHLGCAMANQIPLALKCIIKTYPNSSGGGTIDSFDNMASTSLSEYMNREDPSPSLVDSYNRILETMLSILSSSSPHLLHSIFHEVISHFLLINEQPKDLKIYLLRIADKITNICEGDLEYSVALLSGVLTMKGSEGVNDAASKYWETIKAKVLPNISPPRLPGVVEWLCESLSGDTEYENPEVGTIIEVVQLISAKQGNKNPLIRSRSRKRHQLQPLLTPLLYWLDYAAANQDRLPLFETVWSCIVSLTEHFNDIYISRIVLPLLHKTKDFCANSTPPTPMLRFLQITLNDCKDSNPEFIEFLMEFLPIFAQCVPSSVHDDTFAVFTLLIRLVGHRLSDDLLILCLDTLLDQYTVKSSAQKQCKHNLVEQIIQNPKQLYSTFCYCLFENFEETIEQSKDYRQQQMSVHDFYIEKVSFSIEIIVAMLDTNERSCFQYLDKFAEACFKFLMSNDSNVRIRALEILRLLGELALASTDEQESVGASRVQASKLICAVIKYPLEQAQDSKISFYSLQLADLVFKHILPPPSEEQPDKKYLDTRYSEIFKIWGGIQEYVSSPWSNIRAIAFSVICTWALIDLQHNRALQKLKTFLHPLLMNLLSSKESESRAGALNILGSFCGLNMPDEKALNVQIFRQRAEHVPISIWEQVYHLQEDWDVMIREAATVLIQLWAPRESVRHFYKMAKEESALKCNIVRDHTPASLKHSRLEEDTRRSPQYPSAQNSFHASSSDESFGELSDNMSDDLEEEDLFWVDSYEEDDVQKLIKMFRNDARNPTQLWNEQVELRDDETKESSKEDMRVDEDEESLEQLGVIDVEDEELLEGCDDEHNNFPVIKNAYRRRKEGDEDTSGEDHGWSMRPAEEKKKRPSTPPPKGSKDLDWADDFDIMEEDEDQDDEVDFDKDEEEAADRDLAALNIMESSAQMRMREHEEQFYERPGNPTFDEHEEDDDDEEEEEDELPFQIPVQKSPPKRQEEEAVEEEEEHPDDNDESPLQSPREYDKEDLEVLSENRIQLFEAEDEVETRYLPADVTIQSEPIMFEPPPEPEPNEEEYKESEDLPKQIRQVCEENEDAEEDTEGDVFHKFDKILQSSNTDRPIRYGSEFGRLGSKPRTISPEDKFKAKTDRGITEWSKSYNKFKTMFGELEDYINKSPRMNRDYEQMPMKLKNLGVGAPTGSSMQKIYLQKPDLTLFNRKKAKSTSLNTSLNRNRKASPGMRGIKTPKQKVQGVSALPLPYPKPQYRKYKSNDEDVEEFK